jgi:hypothetical protein
MENMMRLAPVVLLAGLAASAIPAHAQSSDLSSAPPLPPSIPAPPAQPQAADDGRYSFQRVQDTVLRLDSRTGQVSTCRNGPTWTCQTVPDERTALESEIGRLQRENAALKKDLLARSGELPGIKPDAVPPVAKAPEKTPEKSPELRLPTESDLDRVKSFVGDVWRRLVEMMAELQRDIQRKS